MKTRFTLCLVVAAFALSTVRAFAQTAEQQERIAASFVLALGRTPSAAETKQWSNESAASVTELLARHQQQLQRDTAAKRAVVVKAYQDAFGRAPTDAEISGAPSDAVTYIELLKRHTQWLADHPTDFEQTMRRAYPIVISREIYPEEIEYWKKVGALPFAFLAGCLDDWARRNQPGLMVTNGNATVSVNCILLTTVRLSPAIAAETRSAAGLPAVTDTKAGHNFVGPGGDKVLTGGRIHFAAVGSPNLTAR